MRSELRSSADKIGSLQGSWVLNTALMKQERGGGHGRMPGGGGFGGGMGGRGGGMVGGRSGMDQQRMEEMRGVMMHALEAPTKLLITQGQGTISFTEADGVTVALATNNRKQNVRVGSSDVEIKAKWDDKRLVKETSLKEGFKTVETYSVSPETRQMLVQVKLEGPRSLTLTRVYDNEAR
jgi:hypothetical protein